MDWDYAQMTHEASLYGGPEAYVSAIRYGGVIDGRIEGAVGATLISLAIGGIIKIVRDKVKKKRNQAALAEERIKVLLEDKGIIDTEEDSKSEEDE
ncbi:hypothetical protein [Eggerthella lenta]|uniref:hypothetical protein n=1 Tax=Eggerthella lenta TaxID=84112 RepID=UPI000DF789F9|nr:hypothetical protein [Eggerthella lenta]RDB97787.1 hypothetical protein C1867_04580 [Eggerthella lenta]